MRHKNKCKMSKSSMFNKKHFLIAKDEIFINIIAVPSRFRCL